LNGKMDNRPPRDFVTGKATRALWTVALVGAPAILTMMLVRYASLPETVATHFDRVGEPDHWGPKWAVLAAATLVAAAIEALVCLARQPQLFNYLAKVTEANAQAVYREGERAVIWAALAALPIEASIAASPFAGDMIGLASAGLGAMVAAAAVGTVRACLAASAHNTPGVRDADGSSGARLAQPVDDDARSPARVGGPAADGTGANA
jgi:hypothetical protein